jgi:CelD/BcsL family acetyltransferase involved in cellulose biosynthesis
VLKFEIASDSNSALAMTERLLVEKARALALLGVPDPFADPAVRDYYQRQTMVLYPAGPTHVSALTLNGEPISLVWGLISNKRFYYIVTGYDPQHSKGSPGRMHLNELLRWAVENGLDYFDLGVGDQDYKAAWCEEHVALFATVKARSLRGIPVAVLLAAKTWAKWRIKSSPRLWALAQRVRARKARRSAQSSP